MATIRDALKQALRHHQTGDLRRAENLYREILRVDPAQPVALHFLGVVFHQRGEQETAAELISRALEIVPDDAAAHNNLANVLQDLGKLEDAVTHYRRVLEITADDALAHNNLGNAFLKLGQADEAVASYRNALRLKPQYPEAHSNLGNALRRLGRIDEAVESYRRALELKPDHAEAHNNLGAGLLALGMLDEAESSLLKAVEIRPGYAEAHNNLGNVHREQGRFEDAMLSYQRAVELKPDHAEACSNLGRALRMIGRLAEAVTCYQLALQIRPEFAEAHNNLGNVYQEQGRLEEAAACYERALQHRPDVADFHGNRGNVFRALGRTDEAAESYRRALQLEPGRAVRKVQIATLCPAVFPDNAAILRYREGLRAEIDALAGQDLSLDPAELGTAGSAPPFALPCQGGDDRPLKEAFAGIFRRPSRRASGGMRSSYPRVGMFVSRNHEGVFLRCMGDVIARLGLDRFELAVVCSQAGVPRIRPAIPAEAIRIVAVPDRLDRIVEIVGAEEFDLLYHWEVGTDPINYFLPFFALAPVQCTSWGFPVTSGIPEMDYYLASELVEDEGTEQHYSETQLRSKTLMTYQRRVAPPEPIKTREEFGLGTDRHLYLCAQRLEKIHPDFDRVMAEILRKDAKASVVLVEDRHGQAAARLRGRFDATAPDVRDRLRFVPRQNYGDYLGLLAAADVVLDSPHYTGALTTYDALSLNKAVVTWPSRYARGRYTYGCYRKMGSTRCVAGNLDEYAEIALRLGMDADHRSEVEQEISRTSQLLFEDDEAVAEHERLFREMIEGKSSRRLRDDESDQDPPSPGEA